MLSTCPTRRYQALPGRALKGWMNSGSFVWRNAGRAFHQLPLAAGFVAARLAREFSARADFEQRAEALFAKPCLGRCAMYVGALAARQEKDSRAAALANIKEVSHRGRGH